MQILKTEIQERILVESQRLFAEKGFLKTSMRDIAVSADVGVGNLYNYFENKDEIFQMVLKPVTSAYEWMLQKHHGHPSRDASVMMSEDYFKEVVQEYTTLIKKYRTLMKLLLFQAQGSSLENFREQFTDRATMLVKEWFMSNKQRHPEINTDVSDFFIHMHTVWMFSLFEEIIMHNVRSPQMEQIVEEYVRFEIYGWKYLMKI